MTGLRADDGANGPTGAGPTDFDRTDFDRTDFDRATALTPIDGRSDRFAMDLDPGWSSLVGMHGGYLCSVVVRGAEQMASGRPVRTMTTSFLRTARAGPATLSVREVRMGRTVATLDADLTQDDQLVLTSRLTLMAEQRGVEWGTAPPVDLPPPAACVDLAGKGPVRHLDRVDARFDPQRLPFTGERARIAGYVRPLEHRALDSAWLVMASDWFPPPAFALVEPPTGGISVDLVAHVHRPGLVLGTDDWLVGDFGIETSAGGLAVERGRLSLLDGTVVAESFQTRLMAQR